MSDTIRIKDEHIAEIEKILSTVIESVSGCSTKVYPSTVMNILAGLWNYSDDEITLTAEDVFDYFFGTESMLIKPFSVVVPKSWFTWGDGKYSLTV